MRKPGEWDYVDIQRRMDDPGVKEVPNEEMIALFQHYVDTLTLPQTTRHIRTLSHMVHDGVVTLPEDN